MTDISSIVSNITQQISSAISPGVTPTIVAAPTNNAAAASASGLTDKGTIAGNFQTFLQLLTAQLQHQNPLDPLDTNQFTQQLVQFAQVEQQLKSNDQLSTLIALQQTAQQTQALAFVGMTVAVDGATTKLANGMAQWSFSMPKPASATITITNSTGQTVYAGSYTVQTGQQNFVWDGKGNNGVQWPDGTYKMSVTAKDASGQTVAVSTEVQGKIDSVDLTQNPPVLTVGGQTFTLNQIRRVVSGA